MMFSSDLGRRIDGVKLDLSNARGFVKRSFWKRPTVRPAIAIGLYDQIRYLFNNSNYAKLALFQLLYPSNILNILPIASSE